jgi:hypothetical protein
MNTKRIGQPGDAGRHPDAHGPDLVQGSRVPPFEAKKVQLGAREVQGTVDASRQAT